MDKALFGYVCLIAFIILLAWFMDSVRFTVAIW